MRLAVNAFVTLDGVMQTPGAPDEHHEGGFQYGDCSRTGYRPTGWSSQDGGPSQEGPSMRPAAQRGNP
jgi:hypothetical protein